MPYTPVLGVLGYVLSPDRERVLLIHRVGRAGDHQLGKYNGLGGKVEPDEDVVAALRRELAEEAQIELTSLRLRGTVSWPGFGAGGEDWFGFIFVIDAFTGTVAERNPEGVLEWVPLPRLLAGDLPMWEGDRHFLPLVFAPGTAQFHGVMPYRDGRPVGWSYSTVP